MIMREKYGIRASCCGDCCATSRTDLGCCVVSQMARHTNDYEAYPVECCSADCFSRTGQNAEARANDQVLLAIQKLREHGAPSMAFNTSEVRRTVEYAGARASDRAPEAPKRRLNASEVNKTGHNADAREEKKRRSHAYEDPDFAV